MKSLKPQIMVNQWTNVRAIWETIKMYENQLEDKD